MTTDDTTVAVSGDAIAALDTKLAQLSDLFVRRLREDAGKNALIETVQEQLRAANDLVKYRDLEHLFRETVLVVDRLQGEPPTPELVQSAVDELLEVFRRRQLIEVDDHGEFDPRLHEAVDTVPADADLAPNTIVAVQRKGYFLGDRLLRPAQVTIAVSVDERSD